MSKLKPIGSEKLQGSAKLDRILEIAMYKEVEKSNINESSSNEFGITLPDGKQYFIVKEKSGYIIKKGLNESTLDYIEPMKNRSYYRSYSQALKKLNLITKELNEIYNNHGGLSLFGEQKKYTLKTPRPNVPEPSMDEPLAEPPAVPNPELPPSPLSGGDEMPDMEGMDGEMPDMEGMDGEMPEMGDEMPDMDDDMPDMDNERKQDKGDEQVTFKTIQKLTGRLTQKIRTIENEKGLTSEEIKYVLNMVISSIDLNNLDGDDRDDIVSKLDSGDEMDDMDMEGEMPDMDMDMEGMDGEMPDMEGMDGEMPDMEGMDGEMPDMEGMDGEMPEMQPRMNNRRSSNMGNQNRGETYTPRKRFEESKVDSVLSKYFEVSPNEQRLNEIKRSNQQLRLNENLNNAKRFSVSKTQLESVKKFLNENRAFNIVGRTNLDNVVLENKNKKSIRINKNGNIL
jgi:hypothetical protein